MKRNLAGGRALRTTARVLLLVLLCGASWARYAVRAFAQENPTAIEQTYSFVLVGVPLGEALNTLIDRTQISLIYETELVADKAAYCRAYEQTLEEALTCILQDTGLDYARLSSGTYVLLGDPRTKPQYGRLMGRVLDADTGAPLANANILLEGAATGAATNQAGRFAFAALRPGPHRLVVTHVAYHDRADTIWVLPAGVQQVAFSMQARTVLTEPIVIDEFASRLPSDELGLGRRNALALTEDFGTGDVVQDMDAIVGVRIGDALADVHVQGGASGEHQFRLDGATVFVPIQNGGFIGPFSPFAVQQITVQKAGFEAAHGSHLSGVIEVEHRTAPVEQHDVVVQLDPLSLNGRVSGKMTRRARVQASWMVAGRKSLWGLYKPRQLEDLFQTWSTADHFLIEALQASGGAAEPTTFPPTTVPGPIEVGFNDLHAAVRVQRDGLHSLHASFYRGRNIFGNDIDGSFLESATPSPNGKVDDEYAWTNTTSQVRYEGVLGSRTFASLGLWTSSYGFTHPFNLPPFADINQGDSGIPLSEDFNDIAEVGLRAGWSYAATAKHFLSGNVEAISTSSEFSLTLDPFGTTPPIDPTSRKPVRWRMSTFLEDRLVLNHRTTLTLGTRLTYLPSLQGVFAEPRLSIQYDHPKGRRGVWALRGAAGLYRQFINQFDVATYSATALVPSVRFWLPVGIDGRPQKAYHVTLAFLYRPTTRWQVSVEAFYKHHPHLLVLDYGGQAFAIQDGGVAGNTLLTDAVGYAHGVALSLRRATRTTRFMAQYEYADARRRVPNRFDGAYVAVPWNTPHRFYTSLDVMPFPHWTATLRWQGVTGRTWGFRQAYYDYLQPNPITRQFAPFDLSDPGAHRLPFFSQWDVGLAYAREVLGREVQGRIGFINLLGRKNVTDWSLRFDEETETYHRVARRATAFIPTLSLRVSL